MEATVGGSSLLRQLPLGIRRRTGDAGLPSAKSLPTRVKMGTGFGFKDEGHLRYYATKMSTASCESLKKEEKRRKKLVKGLEEDLYELRSMGFGVDNGDEMVGQVQGQILTEAADVLLAQLGKLRAEAKEMKKKRKQEEKAAKTRDCAESSSSSSESSDSECEREVVNMSDLRTLVADPIIESPLETKEVVEEAQNNLLAMDYNNPAAPLEEEVVVVENKIEVCMGGKCKKAGAMELMGEFEKAVGAEGVVIGCKCMGKCKEGPNVRVSNLVQGDGKGPLCVVGVGLEDVGSIVSNFCGESKDATSVLACLTSPLF